MCTANTVAVSPRENKSLLYKSIKGWLELEKSLKKKKKIEK